VRPDRAAFPPLPTSAAEARQFVRDGFNGVDCAEVTLDTAVILVSELATNAIRHAGTPFTVSMHHDPPNISIEVADASSALPVLREPDVNGGRGLQMLAALATNWGVRNDADGKTVFFTLGC
jgi:anti-sigma regulatory factor (Ser/Thr protein kinase)